MSNAEELDQILDTWPEHNTKQEHEAIRAALNRLMLKERRDELRNLPADRWGRIKQLTIEIERSSNVRSN